jgi:nucleotide-binding universal stress UspA family protein
MQGRRILVPVNLPLHSFEALLFAKQMAGEVPLSLTLLHVVRLNIAFESRVYDELCLESEEALRQIGRRIFGATPGVNVIVRVGKPHEEIVAEAQSASAELILLSTPKPSFWKTLLGEGTVRGVVRAAPCPTLVLPRIWKATMEDRRGAAHPFADPISEWSMSAPALRLSRS